MPKLVLIRHGNTFDKGDVVLRVGARTDLPLSSSGREQADKLGAHLKAEGLLPTLVFTSELKRTQETASRALATAGHTCKMQARKELNEIDYGPDEGKPEPEVIARLGEAVLRRWDEQTLMPAEWSPRPDDIRASIHRLLNELNNIPAEIIWIVTSNGIARFIPELCRNSGSVDIKLKTAAYGVVELRPDGPHLASWGERAPS